MFFFKNRATPEFYALSHPYALPICPLCTVRSQPRKTQAEPQNLLEDAGYKLADVTNDPNGKPEDAGKITTSNPPAGDKVPVGTEVDVKIVPPACSVPNVLGMTEDRKSVV